MAGRCEEHNGDDKEEGGESGFMYSVREGAQEEGGRGSGSGSGKWDKKLARSNNFLQPCRDDLCGKMKTFKVRCGAVRCIFCSHLPVFSEENML